MMLAPRWAQVSILSSDSSAIGSCTNIRSTGGAISIGISRLFRSWASPPAKRPTPPAVGRRSSASRRFCSEMSRLMTM